MENKLKILLVDDEKVIHESIGDYIRDSNHSVVHTYDGNNALKMVGESDFDLILVDVRMPGMDGLALLASIRKIKHEIPVVIITGHGSLDIAIEALRNGADNFLKKPIKLLELDLVIEKAVQIKKLMMDRQRLQGNIRGIQSAEYLRSGSCRLVGTSQETQKVRELVRHVVENGFETILITGETGTGKEVVAKEIHFKLFTEESPFIAVCSPAMPESLVESELFGHVKGSFTGSTEDKPGYFEQADGGTLFLDEIGDLSLSVQAKLLRVLETRTFRRIGSSKEIMVNVKIIAATNSHLKQLIREGRFRQDLFYRLNIFPIHLLPLRKRKKDIIPIAEHFLFVCSRSMGLRSEGFSPEAKELLLRYNYPGNVRELKNIVERSVMISRSNIIKTQHLNLQDFSDLNEDGNYSVTETPDPLYDKNVNNKNIQERELILKTLETVKWNRRQAAKKLGIPYSTFNYKLLKYSI